MADVRAKASAVCRAADVAVGPLLHTCMLDVAVIGQDAAAKVFVIAPTPVAVGTMTGGGSSVPSLLVAVAATCALVSCTADDSQEALVQ